MFQQHNSSIASLFAAVAIGIFAIYEVFFFPSYLYKVDIKTHKKIKKLFVIYHIPWRIISIYVALLENTLWNAWISVFVMVGFTFWGVIAQYENYNQENI